MSEPSKPSGGGLVGGAALGNSSSSNSNSGMQVPPLPGSLVGGLTGVGGLRGSGGVAPGRLARTGTPVQGSISLNAGNIVGGIGGMGGMGGGGFGGGLAGGGSGMNPASASAASLGANRSSSGTSAIGGGANYVNVGSSLNGATDEFADDRSDAATIGTSIADWGETHDAPVVSAPADTFDAVKRWALRVNNSYPMSQVTGDIDELVLVDRPLAPAIPPSSSSAINSVRGLASAARPSRFRRMSSKIDPAYLNEFLSTLDESDAEAMCNFVASYHGPDVISAMHTHLAKIQDLRAAENNKEEMPLKPLEWESLPLVDEGDLDDGVVLMRREQQNRSQPAGTVAFSSSTEDGLFSDEADVWEQTEGAQSAAESDWIVLDDYSVRGGQQLSSSLGGSLQHLPKKALTKILTYSANPNLLKTSRRLARLPLPTLGQELAQVILALIPVSNAATTGITEVQPETETPATPTTSTTPAAIPLPPLHPVRVTLNEILTRAARCPYANRSHLTLPCLARLATPGAAAGGDPSRHVTVETLGAVVDIAAKERRWNTVRGAVSLARTCYAETCGAVVVGVPDVVEQSMRRPGVVIAAAGELAAVVVSSAAVSGAGSSAGSFAESEGIMSSAGASSVAAAGPGAAAGSDVAAGVTFVSSERVYAGLVANIVANHGKGLNVAFYKDLVEDGCVVFGDDVIHHCSEHYGMSASVVEYLLLENEKRSSRIAAVGTTQGHLS